MSQSAKVDEGCTDSMATQRYSVTPHPVDTLLTWVKSGEIAIPAEIQRLFVWEATKVREVQILPPPHRFG